jgi:hypothetical protein
MDTDFQSGEPQQIGAQAFQQIEVTVFTVNAQFNGRIICKPQQRLLDVLNARANMNNQLSHDFLEIRDMTIFDRTGQSAVKRLEVGYARRSNIIFVGERECLEHCRVDKPHPMRDKKPIMTEIELPQVLLKGAIYAETWQDLPGALHRNESFLPVTGVRLDHPLVDGTEAFNFVAVNRDHIIFIGAEIGESDAACA